MFFKKFTLCKKDIKNAAFFFHTLLLLHKRHLPILNFTPKSVCHLTHDLIIVIVFGLPSKAYKQ
ncbi:hypothetical protein pah_c258o003 [Parachlamydia acanthamoebae str. Hall's coccus]|nr:hypothetical protein pah_c258o003 [Parachlamydia acanthamoebae str. Hall's coccus]